MCSSHSIPECCVMFSGVKLSMGSFVLFMCPIANRIAGYMSCKCSWMSNKISWNGVSLCFHPASD